MLVPALPVLASTFGRDISVAQMTVSLYMVGIACSQIIMGPLSDRFGLWLGFHNADQDTFFAMIEAYARYYKLGVSPEELRKRAVEWSITRGSRSGRVAWQFVQEVAGELGKKLD